MSLAIVIKNADFSQNALDVITLDRIHADSISISEQTLEMTEIGATQQLSATTVPSMTEDPIVWRSSNEAVATVDDTGLVEIVGVGECTITVTSGVVSASCAVTVIVEVDFNRYKQTMAQASTSTNRLTYFDSMNAGSSNYLKYLCCCNAESTYTNLIIDKDQTVIDSETGVYRAMIPSEMISGSPQRVYNNVGYPIPAALPSNCSKIKCVAISDDYAPYVMFFQKDVRAYPAGSSTEGRGYVCANRYLCDPLPDVTLNYQAVTEIVVPDGYDSICVVFVAKDNATMFPSMSDSQISSFKVYAE